MSQSPPSDSRMGFFLVPLVCEAASHVGCGTRARAVLAEIEQAPFVGQAWLSREGTVLAIVWTGTPEPSRLLRILGRHRIAGVELGGDERRLARKAFAGGGAWYRAGEMQELSDEEARVIAVRLVSRLARHTSLPEAATERLRQELEQACAHALAEASPGSASVRREQIASSLLKAGQDVLEPAAFSAFAAVVARGHRPLAEDA